MPTVFVLAAFSLFSPLSLFAVNAPRGASPAKFLVVAGASFATAMLLVSVLQRRIGLRRSTSIVAAGLFVFFSWSAMRSLGEELDAAPLVADTVVPLLILGLAMWAAIRFGEARGTQVVMMAIGVALVVAPLPSMVIWYATDAAALETPAVKAYSIPASRPDVYFVVLDGYGRGDVLEGLYGWSNQAFLGELRDQGFFVPEGARANYSMTAASVPSALAMDYLVGQGVVPDDALRLALYRFSQGDNPVVDTLKGIGYQYVHIESGWDGSRCGDNVDVCYKSNFFDEASWTLASRTVLAAPLRARYGHAFSQNGLRSLDSLSREAATSRVAPRLVFAHVLLPHPPLKLDSRCEVRLDRRPEGGAVGARSLAGTRELQLRKSAYVEQVECVNQKVLRFLEGLGDDTLVFMTGDHGPDSDGQPSLAPEDWTESDIFERFSVLSAYRLPEGCQDHLDQNVDLINGMRIMVGCALGVELPSLPSQSFIFPTPDANPYPVTEVDTSSLGG